MVGLVALVVALVALAIVLIQGLARVRAKWKTKPEPEYGTPEWDEALRRSGGWMN